MYYWLQEGRDEAEWDKVRSRLEMPPMGYEGSLKGTVWDHDEILRGYDQGGV